jgi:hypothetical protein
MRLRFTFLIYVLFAGILVFSCETKTEKKEPGQMEAVMAIHDEVMPKMGEIGKLVAKLKPMADSTETGIPYLKAMTDLQDAHAAMMDWMKGFGDRFDYEEIMEGKKLDDQKIEWLKEEDLKVRAMRDQVNQSLEAAERLLSEE